MKNVTFYLLNRQNTQFNNINCIEKLVCNITAKYWRMKKRILILCKNKEQAIRFNEVLWIEPPESFIPHNLIEKNLKEKRSPIEIGWTQKCNSKKYDLLITLHDNFNEFFKTFIKIVDFVPYEESLKKLARLRYKSYKEAGFNLNTIVWK